MIKKMCINIEIDTDYNTPQQVKDLIQSLIKETSSQGFSIETVTIDDEENFKNGVGFKDLMARHFI